MLPRLAGMFFKVGNLIRNFFDNNWARGKQNYSTTEQKGAKLFFSNTKVTYSKFQFTISGDVFSQLCQYFCPLKNYSTFSCFPQNAKSFLIWTKWYFHRLPLTQKRTERRNISEAWHVSSEFQIFTTSFNMVGRQRPLS